MFKALESCYVNNNIYTFSSDTHVVKNYDRLSFSCCFHAAHLYVLVFPNLRENNNDELNIPKNIRGEETKKHYLHDKQLQGTSKLTYVNVK
jgi:hypothetical protein